MLLLSSAFANDQWVIIDGLGQHYEDLVNHLSSFFEENDFKKKILFRLWIIVNEQ